MHAKLEPVVDSKYIYSCTVLKYILNVLVLYPFLLFYISTPLLYISEGNTVLIIHVTLVNSYFVYSNNSY